MKINVITNLDPSILERERPKKSRHIWDYSYQPKQADIYVVYGITRLLKFPTGTSPKIFVCIEPPEIAIYDLNILQNYDLVLAPDFAYLRGLSNHRVTAGLLNWSIGNGDHIYSQSALRGIPSLRELFESKTSNNVTMIVSNKKMTRLQRKRLNFAKYLMGRLDNFELFGRSIRPITDKISVLAPSKFHIAIENSEHPGYWTEKLADPIICLNHVFYFGDPTAGSTFHPDCVTQLPIDDFEESLKLIEHTISRLYYEDTIERLVYARTQVLTSLNLHCAIERNIESLSSDSPKQIAISTLDCHRLSRKLQARWLLDSIYQKTFTLNRSR